MSIIVTTGESFEGKVINQYLGVVRGTEVLCYGTAVII